jgi:hypothetical protein
LLYATGPDICCEKKARIIMAAPKRQLKDEASPDDTSMKELTVVQVADLSAIAARAYELWQARGCPEGSPDEDWFQAERELKMSD